MLRQPVRSGLFPFHASPRAAVGIRFRVAVRASAGALAAAWPPPIARRYDAPSSAVTAVWRAIRLTVFPQALVALALLAVAPPLAAQQRDSLRAGVTGQPVRDTVDAVQLPLPPLSARRAFLTSLAFPGYAQARFDRPTATALFVAVEAAGLLMVRKSLDDLRLAKRLGRDSLPARFDIDPTSGLPRLDDKGAPIVLEWLPPPYSEEVVRARRTHLEDWIAVLVFNHLIAGADAFVSAHLWDVPAAVSIGAAPGGRGTTVSASLRW